MIIVNIDENDDMKSHKRTNKESYPRKNKWSKIDRYRLRRRQKLMCALCTQKSDDNVDVLTSVLITA
jgi:hypothetical protein